VSTKDLPIASTARAPIRALLVQFIPVWCVLLMLASAPFGAIGRDLWTDEAFTLTYLQHSTFAEMLADVRKNEETPPLYFLTIWAWATLVGNSVVEVRLLSLLFGCLAVALFAWVIQRWRGPVEALIAGMALALAPQFGPYLVEARRYTLEVLLTIGLQVLYEMIRKQPRHQLAYIAYALVGWALLMTSYFGAAIVIAHAVLTLIDLLRTAGDRTQRLRYWVLVYIVIAAGTAFWWPTMAYQVQRSSAVTAFWGNWPSDYYWMALSMLLNAPARGNALLIWMFAAIIGWGLLLLAISRSRQQDDGLLLRMFAVPMLMVFAMVFILEAAATRYMLGLLPGACLALALGYRALQARLPRLALPAIGLVLGTMLFLRIGAAYAPELTRQPSTPRPIQPWTKLVPVIAAQVDPMRDVILFHPPWDQRIFEYYAGDLNVPLLGAHDYDTFYYWQGYQIKTTWTTDEAITAIGDRQRVWVFYDQIFHGVPALQLPYRQVGSWDADGLKLYLYERP
jgi:uncharacterized membrane protein